MKAKVEKKLHGIVFCDDFASQHPAPPRITVWQHGRIDDRAIPATVVIFPIGQREEVLTRSEVDAILAERDKVIEGLRDTATLLLAEFDDENVLAKTPIAYHRHFEALRELIASPPLKP